MSKRTEIRVPELPEPISHYTDAVRYGDTLYVSGCVAAGPDWEPLGGDDPLEQTRATLRNMEAILAAVGACFSDVLKVTVYLTDIEDRASVDIARREFFGDARPASTLVSVSALAHPAWKIEMEAVVGIPG